MSQLHSNLLLGLLPALFPPGFFPKWFQSDVVTDIKYLVAAWLVANLFQVIIQPSTALFALLCNCFFCFRKGAILKNQMFYYIYVYVYINIRLSITTWYMFGAT